MSMGTKLTGEITIHLMGEKNWYKIKGIKSKKAL